MSMENINKKIIIKSKVTCNEYPLMNVIIEDDKIKVMTHGIVTLYGLASYLIHNTDILDYEYIRKCPYRLYTKDTSKGSTEFRINWLFGDELKENDTLILKTFGKPLVIGHIECFIIDLLEIFKLKRWVEQTKEGKFKSKELKDPFYEFIEKDINKSPEVLKKRGYTIPEWYEKYYNENL